MSMCEVIDNPNDLPQYVQRDLDILYNYEFSYDQYGYEKDNSDKIALKLFRIAEKYPQKHLWAVLTYLGYFCGEEELDETDYRDEIRHLGEYYFKQAMNNALLMYDGGVSGNIKKQVAFIEIGLIDGWFGSVHEWRAKLPQYEDKYPQKSVDII